MNKLNKKKSKVTWFIRLLSGSDSSQEQTRSEALIPRALLLTVIFQKKCTLH